MWRIGMLLGRYALLCFAVGPASSQSPSHLDITLKILLLLGLVYTSLYLVRGIFSVFVDKIFDKA